MDTKIWLWAMIICSHLIVIVAAETDPNDLGVLYAIKSSWKNLPPDWKGSDPCGSNWEGINCTDSRVTSLVLAGMGVSNNDIGDITSLSMLRYLDLSNNKEIKAILPQSIENLKNLTTLILVGCSFNGQIPDSIGSIKKLVFLALNNNSFVGRIPPSIGNLTSLSWLDLSDNQLSGPIPVSSATSLGLDNLVKARHLYIYILSSNLPHLFVCFQLLSLLVLLMHALFRSICSHLANNNLSGPIPSQLFNSNMSLLHFIVNSNRLSGTIPSSIGTVQTLEVVRLDSNLLTGTVPQELSNLTRVTELYLSNNNLNGPYPNLTGMNSLYYVDMSNNSFDKSEIPAWFINLSLNTILMENTQLQGEIPLDVFQPRLESLVLSNNNLDGILDVGNNYNKQLFVDLKNNSIIDLRRTARYNLNLSIEDNPICEGETKGNYCTHHMRPTLTTSDWCQHLKCGSFKVPSPPNCTCTTPYVGIIYFYSHSFSNLQNATYHISLQNTLMSAMRAIQLPVESITLSIPSIIQHDYLQYRLHIFPSGQDYFNRSSVSSIGTVINRQSFNLSYYGPLFFLDEPYCCFSGYKSRKHVIIIGGVVGGFVIMLIVASAITYGIYQRRQAIKAKHNNPFASWGLDNGSDAGDVPQLKGARWCSFEEIKKCTNNFSKDNIIGSGGYGQVYKGTLDTGLVVAIKRAQQGSLQGAHEFKTEIELLSRIHHKNVVSLVGFCYEHGEQMLIYEYIANGTLKDHLSGEANIKLDWMKRLEIALDSAKGVAYLHEFADPPIIHRDIKSNNILLDGRLTAKVADFGLSKLLGDAAKGYVSTQVKGTLGYMDPEYFMTQQLTEKSDVYSFGVVLLELITARSPIKNGKFIVKEIQEAVDKLGHPNGLYAVLDPSLGSFKKLGGLIKFVDLAMSCVQNSGADRPTMAEIVREIETIINVAILSVGGHSSLNFSSKNIGMVGDLYYPYGDSISDSTSLSVPFETEQEMTLLSTR